MQCKEIELKLKSNQFLQNVTFKMLMANQRSFFFCLIIQKLHLTFFIVWHRLRFRFQFDSIENVVYAAAKKVDGFKKFKSHSIALQSRKTDL